VGIVIDSAPSSANRQRIEQSLYNGLVCHVGSGNEGDSTNKSMSTDSHRAMERSPMGWSIVGTTTAENQLKSEKCWCTDQISSRCPVKQFSPGTVRQPASFLPKSVHASGGCYNGNKVLSFAEKLCNFTKLVDTIRPDMLVVPILKIAVYAGVCHHARSQEGNTEVLRVVLIVQIAEIGKNSVSFTVSEQAKCLEKR